MDKHPIGDLIAPVAFLMIRGDSVRVIPVGNPPGTTVDRIVEMIPDMFDKITDFVEKKKNREY